MGSGAWEVAARSSSVNLNDHNVSSGQINDVMIGLNWYFAQRTHWMFNYIHIHSQLVSDGVASSADIYGVRFQVAW